MKNIWLITTSYGNYSDSHTIRLSNMLGKLDRKKFRISLITPGPQAQNNFDDQIPRLDNVYYTQAPATMRLIKRLTSVPIIGKRLGWIANNLAYRVLIPDQFAGWNKAAELTAGERADKPDVVISASGSPEAHLAARRIAKQSNAKWIADLGDPWHFIDKVNRPALGGRIEKLERQTVREADALTFTTYDTMRLYRDWLGTDTPAQMEVIPYGFDRNEVAVHSINDSVKLPIVFAHVGTAHTNDRNLIPFIRALAGVQRLSSHCSTGLLLAGRRSPAFDEEVTQQEVKNAELCGKVSYQESLRLQAKSDVLIIVGNINGSQIPGKIFICLALGLPILYIAQANADDDEALRLLSPHRGIVIVKNEEQAISGAIKNILSNFEILRADAKVRASSDLVSQYESHALSVKVENVISHLV